MKKRGLPPPFFLRLSLYFEDDAPPLDSELPAVPPVAPLPVVAPGALAGASVPAVGLAGDGVEDVLPPGGVVVPDDAPLLGEVVLGVVVVLEGLFASSLPQPYSAAATNAIARACFTMWITSSQG